MITIRKATQEDLDFARQNPIEVAVKEYPRLELGGIAKTGLVDGEIVGVGGVVIYWEGVGEGWIILSKKVLNFKIEVVMCIKEMMEQVIVDCRLRRLQVTVRVDFPQAKKLVETLGFEQEGLMRKYLPDGTDCWIYAKIIGEK